MVQYVLWPLSGYVLLHGLYDSLDQFVHGLDHEVFALYHAHDLVFKRVFRVPYVLLFCQAEEVGSGLLCLEHTFCEDDQL